MTQGSFRIGKLEKTILQELSEIERSPEDSRPRVVNYRIFLKGWKEMGLPFIPALWIRNRIFGVKNITCSDKSNFSKALKTLAGKDLIKTRNWHSKKAYITHVNLSEPGNAWLNKKSKS